MVLSLLLSMVICLYFVVPISGQECGSGKACIFRGKDLGWEYYTEKDRQIPKYPPVSDSWKKANTSIFLTMASFRDKLCPVTLFNAFTKAKYPERLTIGVVQQNEAGDVDCIEEYCNMMSKQTHLENAQCPYVKQIRILRLSARDAKGPTWGRAKGAQLLKDEEFCMQTDSHMDMTPGWDVSMLNMWGMIENEYAILSTYVTDVHEMHHVMPGEKGIHGLHEVPHLCMVTFGGSHGLVRNWGTKCMRSMPTPKMTNIVWGAGLSFSKCHAERKVPYDPHIPHIFDGEEYSRALRFWTYGYDIYTPHRVYILHNYQGSQSDPKHATWGANRRDPSEGTVEQSVARLNVIFHKKDSDKYFGESETTRIIRSKYGLGDRRTIEQAIAFSGLDTVNGVTIENKCGNNLEYVPFQEHPGGASYVPVFDNQENPLDIPDSGSVYFNADDPRHVEGMKEWLKRFPVNPALQKIGILPASPAATVPVTVLDHTIKGDEVMAENKIDFEDSSDLLRRRKGRISNVGVKQHVIPDAVVVQDGEIVKSATWSEIFLKYYQNDAIRAVFGVISVVLIVYVLSTQYKIYQAGRKQSSADRMKSRDISEGNSDKPSHKLARKGSKLTKKYKNVHMDIQSSNMLSRPVGDSQDVSIKKNTNSNGQISELQEDADDALGLKTV